MEKEKLFKVLDALEIPTDWVYDYLKRITGQTPLNVVYQCKNGRFTVTQEIKKKLTIVGYVLDDIVIFNIPYNEYMGDLLTIGEIKRVGTIRHPKARPISLKELRIMARNAYAFSETITNLKYNGCTGVNPWRRWFIPIDDSMNDNDTVGKTCDITGFFDGASKLGHFANKHGSFYYWCKLDEL